MTKQFKQQTKKCLFFLYLSFEQIIEMVSELKQNLFLASSFRTTSGIQFNMNCLMSVGTEKKLCQTLVREPKCSHLNLKNISARCSDIVNLCFIKDLDCVFSQALLLSIPKYYIFSVLHHHMHILSFASGSLHCNSHFSTRLYWYVNMKYSVSLAKKFKLKLFSVLFFYVVTFALIKLTEWVIQLPMILSHLFELHTRKSYNDIFSGGCNYSLLLPRKDGEIEK